MIHTVELSITRDSDYDFSSVRELFFGGCSPRTHQVRDMQERFPSLQEITHCMYSIKTNCIKYNCIKTNCTIVFLFHMWTYVTRHAKRPARSKFSKVIYLVDSIAVSFLIHGEVPSSMAGHIYHVVVAVVNYCFTSLFGRNCHLSDIAI